MVDELLFSRAYHAVLTGFVHDGRAPHFPELAVRLNIRPEEARQVQRDLLRSLGGPHWLVPGTDDIASFSPFSNVPTRYRLSVDGDQGWHAQ